jgi:hypothetical protein
MFMKVISVREYCKATKVASVATTVRENSNGYPFVTFINGDNEATNVYFSKEGAKHYTLGESIGKGFFDKLQVAYVTNEEGEERIKLITNSERISIDDIL